MREQTQSGARSVSIVLLAAGQASRMGGRHKLLATFDGVPLVRIVAARACATGARVIVVTGHRHLEIRAALAGLAVETVHNTHYASGMASSIVAGFEAAAVLEVSGVMIMLADMPAVETADLVSLMDAFVESAGAPIVCAVSDGKRGNPVVLPLSLRPAIAALTGDVGARGVIDSCGLEVIDVDIGSAAHLDVDTPEAVIEAGGVLRE